MWNQSKCYENYQKHILPSLVPPQQKETWATHFYTAISRVYCYNWSFFFFFLISKTVEKPNSHNQHFWLNHCFWFHWNTFLGLFSLSTIVVFLQVVKNHTISHYHYFIFNITMFLSFSDEVKYFMAHFSATLQLTQTCTQTLHMFSSAPKPRELQNIKPKL